MRSLPSYCSPFSLGSLGGGSSEPESNEKATEVKPWNKEEARSQYDVWFEGLDVITRKKKGGKIGGRLGFTGSFGVIIDHPQHCSEADGVLSPWTGRPFALIRHWKEWYPDVSNFLRLIFRISPMRFLLQIIYGAISSLTPMVKLFFSTKLIAIAYGAIEGRAFDQKKALMVFVGNLLVNIMSDVVRYFEAHNESIIKIRTSDLVNDQLMVARTRLDVGSMSRPAVREALIEVDGMARRLGGWNGFVGDSVKILTAVISIAAQGGVLARLAMKRRNRLFVGLSFLGTLGVEMDWLFRNRSPDRRQNVSADLRITNDALSDATYESHCPDMKILGLGPFLLDRFRCHLELLGEYTTYTGSLRWFANFFDSTTDSALYLVFAWQTLRDAAPTSLADLQFIRGSAHTLVTQAVDLFETCSTFSEHIQAIRSFYDITKITSTIPDPEDPKPYVPNPEGMEFEFRNVSFDYPTQKGALKNVSFKVAPGKVVAVVGGNGSGKSSLVSVLARLYDTTEGEVLINGINVKEYAAADLHARMSVLWQSTPQLNLSVQEFIGLGNPSKMTDLTAITEVAKSVGAHEKILSKRGGYDARLGHSWFMYSTAAEFLERCRKADWEDDQREGAEDDFRTALQREADEVKEAVKKGESAASVLALDDMRMPGPSFSGGEWRRIACARTLFRDADLRVWDEFASGLDSIGERNIFREIWRCRGKATTFFVTHRYQSVGFVDLILCMHEGKLVEQGTHEELMEMKGHYWTLWTASQVSDEGYLGEKEEGEEGEKGEEKPVEAEAKGDLEESKKEEVGDTKEESDGSTSQSSGVDLGNSELSTVEGQ